MNPADGVAPIADFNKLIAQRTADFAGREWVLRTIDDWLRQPDGERVFLLTGGPGAGKSAIAARLVQFHHGQSTAGGFSRLRSNFLSYYHFCQAGLDSTLAPRRFVESLAQALANRYPVYRQILEKQASTQYAISPVLNIRGGVAAGAQVVGAVIGAVNIEILGGDARALFDQMVRQPLSVLCASMPKEPVVVLIDALDEALSFHQDNTIAHLLRLLADFPVQVRFVLTGRAHDARLTDLVGPARLDLLRDAPPGLNDVRVYAAQRLATVPEPARSHFVDAVVARGQGNFLYAYHVLNDLLRAGNALTDDAVLALPDGLDAAYRQFLRRELAASPQRWRDVYRPLLGALAVARGDGLNRRQLVGICDLADDAADEVLTTCAQYLVGGEAGGAYRLYHQSFRDFLLADARFGVYPAERHAAIAGYLQDKYGANWGTCQDDYALRHTPHHWAEAARLSESRRAARTQTLIVLTGNAKYQRRYESAIRDLPALQQDLTQALRVAALNDGDEMLPWLIRAGRHYVAFQRDYLRAESVIALAEEGRLELAEQRVRLFAQLDENWQAAARLIVAWLGAAANPPVAAASLTRGGDNASDVLRLLSERLRLALDGPAHFACHQLAPVPLDVLRELVKRVSGQDFDRELLLSVNPSLCVVGQLGAQVEMLAQRGYAAEFDAPLLVSAACAHGAEGTDLVDKYIDAHAAYKYVEYRNRSLWIVMRAVLRHHPEQAWVRARLGRLLVAALAGGGSDFREQLPLTATVLREDARGERHTLNDWRQRALSAADALQESRGADDAWGRHRRRLSGLLELYALLAADRPAADVLLDRILALPGGFAGFQALAQLRLADAVRVAAHQRPGLRDSVLENALRSAHHIQDFHFCALVSARCNALRRWHATPLSGPLLAAVIARLASAPHDGEFAVDHVVHDGYRYRNDHDPDTLSITEARQASTLRDLAEVFQRPVVDLLRCNSAFGIDERLVGQTLIRVPDPGFPPLLATHLAARVLAEASLADEGGALLRALVPVAAGNPTTLDTLLAYLLVANRPDDPELLDNIIRETGPLVMVADSPSSIVRHGPEAAIPT